MATASLAVFVSYVRRSLSTLPELAPSEDDLEPPESQSAAQLSAFTHPPKLAQRFPAT